MSYFKLFFFFLFLSLARPVSAQVAKWIHPKSGNIYQINFETKEFFENKDGAQWKKIADLSFQDIKSYDLISGNRHYQEIPIPGSSISYLLVS